MISVLLVWVTHVLCMRDVCVCPSDCMCLCVSHTDGDCVSPSDCVCVSPTDCVCVSYRWCLCLSPTDGVCVCVTYRWCLCVSPTDGVCVCLLQMTSIVLPRMVAKRAGVIINIGSASGISPVPMMSLYSACKVDFLSTSHLPSSPSQYLCVWLIVADL